MSTNESLLPVDHPTACYCAPEKGYIPHRYDPQGCSAHVSHTEHSKKSRGGTLKVTRASVVLRDDEIDRIALYLEADSPFPAMGYEASADLTSANGTGVEWVRKNVGIEPEIIDLRGRPKLKFSRE